MKSLNQKITALVVTAFTTVALLGGCGQKNEKSQNPKPENQEQKVVTWYTISDDARNEGYHYPEIVEAFQKKNEGIKVELKPLISSNNNDDYYKKVDLMLASGETIDFIEFANMSMVAQKVKAGVIEPMDEYAKKENVNLDDEYKGMIQIEGKTYTIPNAFTMFLVFINKNLLDEAGLPVPPADWTWDDYREYAKKLTKGEGKDKIYGSYFHTWEWFNAIAYMNKIDNTPWYKADGSANFDDPVFKQFMQYRYDLENVDKTQIPLLDVKTQKMQFRNVFFSGKVAMMPQGSWMLADIKNTEQYPRDFKVTFATFPRTDKDSKVNYTANGAAGAGFAINKNSKVKEETYKFIRYFTTEGVNISKDKISQWKKADQTNLVKEILGDQKNYDVEQFNKVVLDPKASFNIYSNKPVYDQEIINAFNEESEKFFLGSGKVTVDQAIASLQKRANDIINKAKK